MALRLSVIGTGYLGATHAACMAELGYDVIGYDVDEAKIELLRAGKVPFFEPGLPELLTKQVESGRLRFTTDIAEVAEFGDVHFVCVGTPQMKDSFAADLRYVHAAIDALAPLLARECLVVGKSTVPSGTAAILAARIAELAPGGDAVECVQEIGRERLAPPLRSEAWCGREDSNLHGLPRYHLKVVRLPIPPRPHVSEITGGGAGV